MLTKSDIKDRLAQMKITATSFANTGDIDANYDQVHEILEDLAAEIDELIQDVETEINGA